MHIKIKRNLHVRGFMLAMTAVLVSMVVIVSSSISFGLLKEINRASLPLSSVFAFNYADTAMRCLSAINTMTLDPSSGRGVFDFNSGAPSSGTININSLKCMGDPLFTGVFSISATKISSSDALGVNSPSTFYGGYKYLKSINITSSDGIGNGCVKIESYSKTISSIPKKLLVVTAKVPCVGGVEKVLTKEY